MAVSPRNVLACGCAGCVKESLLRKHHKWAFGMPSVAHCIFRLGNFLHGSAQMNGNSAGALCRLPRQGSRKCVIDFEHRGTIAIPLQQPLVGGRKTVTCNFQELARSHIAQQSSELAKGREVGHSVRRPHRTAKAFKMRAQSSGNRLRPSPRNWPTNGMRGRAENDSECSAERL